MNKIINLLLIAICVISVGNLVSVNAQTNNKILVSAGKQTLRQTDVDKLIEFYEWAFQAEFNSTQKADFQEYTEQQFRANPTESRKTIEDIVKTLPKILAAEEDVQSETRKTFLDIFLPEAKKNSDANSQMLLSIYETANGAVENNDAANNASDNESSKDNYKNDSYETVKKATVGNFSSIVGKWVSGNSGSMTKTTSGVYLGGSGSRFIYQFNANGTVDFTGIMNVMTGGCRMQIFKSAKGKASISGDTLTVNWSPAHFSRDDSCSPSKNYKKTLPAETETFTVNFETYYDDKQLCLTSSDKTCFSKD